MTVEAIKQRQTCKTPGPDGILPEIFKVGGEILTEQLVSLFQLFWERGEVPKDLKDASIVHLNKKTKVQKPPATTTEASHSSALLASFWPASY